MDGPGRVLAEEYARRLGKERCYRITFPDGYKDPNEVLNGSRTKGLPALGAAALLAAKAAAAPYPVKGLLRIEPGTLAALRGKGRYIGIEIAPEWPLFCEHYKPNTGQLTVVSGYPGSGKSEIIDAIAVHLAARHGWKFAVCSPENPPDVHVSKLAEKYIGKQFWADSETLWTDLMSETEMTEAEDWVRAHFTFIVNDDDADLITFDYLLERARIAVRRFGVKGLIIDPYNDFDRPTDMNETEFVRRMLSRVRRFNAVCDVHTWLAAHPAKVQRNRDGEVPIPTLYDISGSAHFSNRADFGLIVHRKNPTSPDTIVRIAKRRFRWMGKPGEVEFTWYPRSGRYEEKPEQG
jgi:twinkle protein